MSFAVTVTLSLTPEAADAFWENVPNVLAETKGRPEVLSVTAYRSPEDPTKILFVDVFHDEAARDSYFAWRNSTGGPSGGASIMAAPPQIAFWGAGVAG
uniref:ABM domain-containing protein n=1 Tax=Caulobacter sp. (strain K31) TaxID=366602 RepID=B0T996_CAUSK